MFLHGLRIINGDSEDKDYYFFYPDEEEREKNIEKFINLLGEKSNGLQTFDFDCPNDEVAQTLLGNTTEENE